jgi:hypothetical protein
MIDPDEREQAALRAALKNMAELMAEIGSPSPPPPSTASRKR